MSEGGTYRLDTDGKTASYLYRVNDPGGYFYSTVRKVQVKQDIELIGVATRYPGDRIRSADSLGEFRDNVSRLAADTYWFDAAVPTEGRIAEFLYRAYWTEDTWLYGATRDQVAFTSHELIGVVVRPPRETVESTKWGLDEFEENVDEVADEVVWFQHPEDRNSRYVDTGVDRDD